MSLTNDRNIKDPILIIAVVHDDVPGSVRKSLYADHFEPLVRELESFTERKVNVIFAGFARHTSFDYKGKDHLATLRKWETLGNSLIFEVNESGLPTPLLTKVILLTRDLLNADVAGAALVWPTGIGGQFAISSLGSYIYVGHEIGHLLGARHEDFEVKYNGWWAETYMVPNREPIRSVAYTYSAANRKNIKNALARYS